MQDLLVVSQSASEIKGGLTSSNPHTAGEVDNHHDGKIDALGDEMPRFSFFRHPVRNAYPCKVLTIYEAYLLITKGSYLAHTFALRTITDKVRAKAFKTDNFDYLTFSGTFTYRNAASLVQHSGLLTIDFDHVDHLDELKQGLLNDERFKTVLLFISPSGDGLKWIIAIDLEQASHLEWFEVVAECIKESYQLDVDPTGKDICRACFLTYDPTAYINPDFLPGSFATQILKNE